MIYKGEFRLNFIGIGASKSGTSWVYDILKKHPNIYCPTAKKELNYFNKYLPQDYTTINWDYSKPYDWYHSYFSNAAPVQIAGEITPSYLSMENSSKDIFTYNPQIKLFAILRHPIERSFSEYLYSRQNGICKYKSFEEAIQKEPKKFIGTSMYYQNLKKYVDLFPTEQIRILLYEDIKVDSKRFLQELYQFLEVPEYYPEGYDSKTNKGLQARNQHFSNFIGSAKMFIHKTGLQFVIPALEKSGALNYIKRAKSRNLIPRANSVEIPHSLRKELIKIFIEDIEQLELLLGRNLSAWKI